MESMTSAFCQTDSEAPAVQVDKPTKKVRKIMNKALFGNTLARYASCEPMHFLQLVGYYVPGEGNDCMRPDRDGDVIEASRTVELMHGRSVRALIPYDADPIMAARQLKKLAKWLKNEPRLLDDAKPRATPSETPPDIDIPF